MGITINNMSINEVSKAVKIETTWLKLAKLMSAIICCVVAIFLCAYHLSTWSTVREWNYDCVDLLKPLGDDIYCKNSTAYDFMYCNGPWSEEGDDKADRKEL